MMPPENAMQQDVAKYLEYQDRLDKGGILDRNEQAWYNKAAKNNVLQAAIKSNANAKQNMNAGTMMREDGYVGPVNLADAEKTDTGKALLDAEAERNAAKMQPVTEENKAAVAAAENKVQEAANTMATTPAQPLPEQPVEQPAAPVTEEPPATEEEVQETVEELQNLDNMTEEESTKVLNDLSERLRSQGLDTVEMKNIFKALKDGDIDKGTAGYFIADALAKMAQQWYNDSTANFQNRMWSTIKSGNFKTPEQVGPNAWQEYLKTDWTEAQRRKNDAKHSTAMANAEVVGKKIMDDYMFNEHPELITNSKIAKLPKDQLAGVFNLQRMMDGQAPMRGEDYFSIDFEKALKDYEDGLGRKATAENLGNVLAGILNQQQSLQLQIDQATGMEKAQLENKMRSLKNTAQQIENTLRPIEGGANIINNTISAVGSLIPG